MNKQLIKHFIYLFGLVIPIVSTIMYLRIFIIISMGYQYIGIEPNNTILGFEILFSIIGLIIIFLIIIDYSKRIIKQD